MKQSQLLDFGKRLEFDRKKNDIEIGFELTLLTYKVFSCKDVRSKFLGVRLLAVQSNTQSRS